MDRNECRKDGWNNKDFAESLKKHGFEHRILASIFLNCEGLSDGGLISAAVSRIITSYHVYMIGVSELRPEWKMVNEEEYEAKNAKDNDKKMESFLKANPLPEPHEKKKKRVRKATELRNFRKLLNDPNAAWKEIDGEGSAI